jgi:hypothetical protein
MLRQIYRFLHTHSTFLQTTAAILAIVAFVSTSPAWIPRWFSPDLAIVLDRTQGAVPPDVKQWVQDITSNYVIGTFPKKLPEPKDQFDRPRLEEVNTFLDKLSESATTKRLKTWSFNFDKITIRVDNTSEKAISHIHLRVNGLQFFWSAAISGQFLASAEAGAFDGKILSNLKPATPVSPTTVGEGGLILPELPTLPPHSGMELTLVVNNSTFADLEVSVEGASYRVRHLVKVEDAWPIRFYTSPLRGFYIVETVIAMLTLYTPAYLIWRSLRRGRKLESDELYDRACVEALESRPDHAMHLLDVAVRNGYSDLRHMRMDSDLASLRERKDFRALTASAESSEED